MLCGNQRGNSIMNLGYDFRGGIPYEAVLACIPPGFRFACNPVAVAVNALPSRVCTEDVLAGGNSGMLQSPVGLHPHVLTTNFNSRIQYMVRSRLDKGQKVTRTVKCEACDITLNSEQQANQHYKGKFHQRKLRQQTRKSDEAKENPDAAARDNEESLSPGVKRTSAETVDESSNFTSKQCRKEDESEKLDENLDSTHSDVVATVTGNDVDITLDEKEMTSPTTTEHEERKDTSKDSTSISESKVIQVNKINKKEVEISIKMKNTYHNSSANLVSGPLSFSSLPAFPSHFASVSSQGLPRGVLVAAPQSIVPSFSFRPAVIPWQNNSAWLPQTIRLQSAGHHNVANSVSSIITGVTTVPQPIVNGHSQLLPQLGHLSAAAASPTEQLACIESLTKSAQFNFESVPASDVRPQTVSNKWSASVQRRATDQAEVKSASLKRQPTELTKTVRSTGAFSSSFLEQLDPVSRAVYGNFLGHFSRKKPKSRSNHR